MSVIPSEELARRWQKTLPPGATDPGRTYKPAAEPLIAPERADRGTIPGGYEFLEEIGRGGMGVVFRAWQGSLRREVAVKRIKPGLAEAEGTFVSEARVTGALDHPNIVPVHELVRSEDGEVLLAMKLVGGRAWSRLLHPETEEEKAAAAGFDLTRHLEILLSVTNAVAFAHSRGVVHRDLKPENVMVGDFGEVLLMDWGLAVDVGEDPSRARAPHRSTIREPAGTPSYMPPEAAMGHGQAMGPWTDTYLLGAILFEVLSARPPHAGRTVIDVLVAALRSEPPTFPEGVPSELQAICRKALAKEPCDRYQTAVEFREAVEGHLRHRESIVISTAAEGTLGKAMARGNGLYLEFAEAVAGFRQARVLWAENGAAADGERRARLAWAEAALAGGDLGLAEAQAAVLDDPGGAPDGEGRALRGRIAAAREARDRAARSARVLRRSLVGAIAVIVVGLVVGILTVRSKERAAVAARDLATLREAEARVGAWKARLETARSLYERSFALESEGRLQAASALLLRAIETAPPDGAPEGFVPGPGTSGWAREAWERFRFLGLRRGGRVATFVEPSGGVTCLAVSGDGRTAVAGCRDGTVAVFDPSTCRERARLPGGGTAVRAVSLDDGGSAAIPAGRALVAYEGEGVALWDLATRRRLETLPDRDGPLAFLPDGRRILLTNAAFLDEGYGALVLRDLEARKDVRSFSVPWGRVGSFAASRDGRTVVCGMCSSINARGSGPGVKVWDVETGRAGPELDKAPASVSAVAISPDGRQVAASFHTTVAVWDLQEGALLGFVTGAHSDVGAVAFSADGSAIWSGSWDRRVRLTDIASDRVLRLFEGHAEIVVEVTPVGATDLVVSASSDGTVTTWDSALSRECRRLPLAARTSGAFYGPDAKAIACRTEEAHVVVLDASTGEAVCEVPEYAHEVAFSPDGATLVGWNGSMVFWDAATGNETRRFQVNVPSYYGAAFSADGRRALVAAGDGIVLDLAEGREVRRFPAANAAPIQVGALSPDGGLALTAGALEGTATLWDVGTGARLRVFEGHGTGVAAVAFLPGGRHALFAGNDRVFRTWDIATGAPVGRFDSPCDPEVVLAIHPGGRLAAVGSRRVSLGLPTDGSIWILDLESGRVLARLLGHSGAIGTAGFSPDGARLLTTSADGAARVWTLLDPATSADPPRLHPEEPDPYREFEPLYRSIGMRVVREGRNQGVIEAVSGSRP